MLPYFKRGENNERGDDAFHGNGGPLNVSDSRAKNPLVDAMIEASRAAGLAPIRTSTAARQEGIGRYQVTKRSGAAAARRRVPAPGDWHGRTST